MITIDKKKLKELKAKSKSLKAIVRIGKNGLSENMIKEMRLLLKKRRLIKVKMLRNSLDNVEIEETVKNVTEECDCILVDKIGLTFSVYR